ncbi:shikimate kinase [Bacillus sp. CGMCC 1.16607]|uniref:shikimate kinase n=1 Tax=Bacillus sp. CGMCC 1.16607 TaxID=3351842 RepID=UPI00363738D3
MDRKKLGEMMKVIYLIGFMGSGKTTIGKALSEKLKVNVYDSDEEIIRQKGKSVEKIFEAVGEDGFRAFETEMLKSLPVVDSIITTGGGVILRHVNCDWMKQNGTVIFLQATPDEILKRLEGDQSRPLLLGDKKTKVPQILQERMPLYLGTAEIIIETTDKSVDMIVQEIVQRLKIS